MSVDPQSIAPRVRVMQIIVLALTIGCLAALVMMAFLRSQQQDAARSQAPFLTYCGLAMCIAVVAGKLVVPPAVIAGGRSRLAGQPTAETDTDGLLGIYQTGMIIGCALLEGGAFFMAVAYLLEGQPLALGIGLAMALGVAAHFPTPERVAAWLENQQEQLRQLRHLR